MFIGSRLKNLRIKNNMTQEELGNKLNVTKVSVCCYERNIRTPSLETLEDLVDIFNVSSDYFLGKDIPVVKEGSKPYGAYVSKEELMFLKKLRLNKELHKAIMEDPKRMVELIDKKLK